MHTRGTLIAALVVLGLSGCSAAVNADSVERVANEPSAVASAEPTVQPTPEVVETPVAAPVEIVPTEAPGLPEFNGFSSQREWFLRQMDNKLSGTVDDDALVGAGLLACEQMRAGASVLTVNVVAGDGPDVAGDNEDIGWAAYYVYCPEIQP
jgi:hypothetical protein